MTRECHVRICGGLGGKFPGATLRPGGRRVAAAKSSQKTLHRQIRWQVEGKCKIPFTATDHEKRHGRDPVWELRAKEAPDHVTANWPGCSWIVEVITQTVERNNKRGVRRQLFLTSVRTTSKALLRLIQQRWSIENEWHWPATPSWARTSIATPTGSGRLCAFLQTIVMPTQSAGGHISSGVAGTDQSARVSVSSPTTSRGCLRWARSRRLGLRLDSPF
jgi:hypothetical protein